MSNEEIAAAFHEIYNGFWLRYRDHRNSESDFERIVEEARKLIEKYPFKLAQNMVLNFLDELDRRHLGGRRKTNGKTR